MAWAILVGKKYSSVRASASSWHKTNQAYKQDMQVCWLIDVPAYTADEFFFIGKIWLMSPEST